MTTTTHGWPVSDMDPVEGTVVTSARSASCCCTAAPAAVGAAVRGERCGGQTTSSTHPRSSGIGTERQARCVSRHSTQGLPSSKPALLDELI